MEFHHAGIRRIISPAVGLINRMQRVITVVGMVCDERFVDAAFFYLCRLEVLCFRSTGFEAFNDGVSPGVDAPTRYGM